MKKVLFLLLVLFCGINYSYTQANTPEQQAVNKAKILSKELHLSGNQAKELRKLLIESYSEADKIRTNPNLSREVKKEQLYTIYAARKENMNSLFNPEQRIKYDSFIQKGKK